MREKDAISKMKEPNTVATLKRDFIHLGIKTGMTLMVHGSMSSMGWVCGGANAVIEALMDIITEEGNIICPTQSFDLSEPSYWQNPAVPETWWQTIRDTMPPFNPKTTPTRGMGKVAEVFRTYPGVIRSNHPHVSFAAWGKDKQQIIENHPLAYALNEDSPLGNLYDLDAHILLLGVGYDSNTCFHLAEYSRTHVKTEKQGAPIIEAGKRLWKVYEDIEFYDDDQLIKIGEAFERKEYVRVGHVGLAQTRLFKIRDGVDFSRSYIKENNL